MTRSLTPSRQDHLIALLAALAISIHLLESALPSPLPGVKPGLANIITLYAFMRFGFQVAWQVTLLRVIAGSILLGTFLSPTFILSFSGALAVVATLWLFHLNRHWLKPSAIGIGVVTALMHILGQFFSAYWVIIPHPGIFALLPIFLLIAVITGSLGGIICNLMVTKLQVPGSEAEKSR